ncbi:MAG: DUF4062 domain-containing protein [Geminicoccaceae bacterium]
MQKSAPQLKVFVSSTSEDLSDYRAAAKEVILGHDWVPRMMEHFGAISDKTVDACLNEVAECQLFLLIIAHRRGWVPRQDQGGDGRDSVTAFELQHARELNIPVLAMLAEPSWPGDLWEDDSEARSWIQNFRKDLNLPAVFFEHEQPVSGARSELPVFEAKVSQLLTAHQKKMLAKAPVRVGDGTDLSSGIMHGLQRGDFIPFVGKGIYGDGPLSIPGLAKALANVEGDEMRMLASAAEYRESKERSRDNFIGVLREEIERQQLMVDVPAAYHLLTGLENTSLIVSTALDQVLEEQLSAAGRSHVVVSHILYSNEGEHDGHVLVKRGDHAEICTADELDISDETCVVYKVLGSPFHHLLDDDIEPDTVVITERDHLRFLSYLAIKSKSVPRSLMKLLKKRPLLFLGYNLNYWQYRLVLELCRAVGDNSRPITVRKPSSLIEAEAWRRLSADIVQSDPNDFAARVVQELALP